MVAGAPHVIALDTMEIVVPAGNPKAIGGLSDLMRPGVSSLACRVTQPCGRYAVLTFARAGLSLPSAATESDGTAIIDQVAHRMADAGLVYTTQVEAADGQVQGVEIPSQFNVGVRYAVVLLMYSEHDRAAVAFYQYLASPAAQNILLRYGFELP
jgi:molybdate transport system substrate-binding protein